MTEKRNQMSVVEAVRIQAKAAKEAAEKAWPRCQRCTSNRLLEIDTETGGNGGVIYQGKFWTNDDMPSIVGLLGESIITAGICLACGQVQGQFPAEVRE